MPKLVVLQSLKKFQVLENKFSQKKYPSQLKTETKKKGLPD